MITYFSRKYNGVDSEPCVCSIHNEKVLSVKTARHELKFHYHTTVRYTTASSPLGYDFLDEVESFVNFKTMTAVVILILKPKKQYPASSNIEPLSWTIIGGEMQVNTETFIPTQILSTLKGQEPCYSEFVKRLNAAYSDYVFENLVLESDK